MAISNWSADFAFTGTCPFLFTITRHLRQSSNCSLQPFVYTWFWVFFRLFIWLAGSNSLCFARSGFGWFWRRFRHQASLHATHFVRLCLFRLIVHEIAWNRVDQLIFGSFIIIIFFLIFGCGSLQDSFRLIYWFRLLFSLSLFLLLAFLFALIGQTSFNPSFQTPIV